VGIDGETEKDIEGIERMVHKGAGIGSS